MTYNDIIKEINKKVFRPVYFLHGSESYFIDVIVGKLSDGILEPAEREFNQTVIYGRDAKMNEIVSTLKSFPMMSNYQVIILKEAQDIKDKDYEILAGYLKAPQPSSILVVAYKKLAGKRLQTLLQKNQKNVLLFESPKVSDDKLPDWIVRYLASKQFECSPKIAQIIAGSLGNDLSKVANELDKLIINQTPGTAVSMDDVEANIGISKKYNVFELQAALANHQQAKAIEIAAHFAANTRENSIFSIIPIVYSFFEKLFVYLQLRGSMDSNAIAAEMKIRTFFLGDYQKAARYYQLNQVLAIFKILRKYDLKAKGVESVSPEGELIKEMIYKIVHV